MRLTEIPLQAPYVLVDQATQTCFLSVSASSTIVCRAEDDAGNAAEKSFTVRVKGAGEQILDQLALIQLARPGSGKFKDALTASHSRLEAGDEAGARKHLTAFQKLVEAESGKALSLSLSHKILANTERIAAVIGS